MAGRQILVGTVLGFTAGFLIHGAFEKESILNSKLLEWPFLTFVLLTCVVMLFFDSLVALLARGEFTIAWSKDQSIKIRNLSAAVSGELAPLQEEIENLQLAVAKLQRPDGSPGSAPMGGSEAADDAATGTVSSPGEVASARKKRLLEALANPNYKWRSVERLAAIIGASEDEVIRILLSVDEARLSRSMTGHPIAGLRSRVGSG